MRRKLVSRISARMDQALVLGSIVLVAIVIGTLLQMF
jgi:hypothetical protein